MRRIRIAPHRRRPFVAAGALVLALAAGCGVDAPSSSSPAAPSSAAAPASASPGAAVQGLVPATVVVPAGATAPFDVPHQALIPPGWTMSLFAQVPSVRLAAWAPDGALLVSRPGAGEVVRLQPDGRGGATQGVLLSGLTQPQGLAFAGSTLYVAESDAVDAYDYAAGAATAPRPVAPNLPDAKSPDLKGAYAHALKNVAVGPDGSVYISVGSTANVSPQDRTATPERAAVLRVPPGGGPLETFSRGLRNPSGLGIAPDGAVWAAVNNRDNIPYPHQNSWDGGDGSSYGQVIPSYVNDHPPEELAALSPGRDLGWPYCNPDPDPQATSPGQTPFSVATPPFSRDVETNADGSRLDCGSLPPIDQTLGAHSSPLGLTFATLPGLGQGALVGVHGSWNRTTPRAPEVSFFPWSGGRMGTQQTLVGGFQAPDGSRWGRPVTAVPGPDGAVYVTDDGAGAIYRLAPPGR